MTDWVNKDNKKSNWLTFEELSELTGWTVAKINKDMQRGKFTLIKYEKGNRCRGGKKPLIHISDPEIPESSKQQGIISFDRERKMAEIDKENPTIHLNPEEISCGKTQRDMSLIRDAKDIPPGVKTDDWYGVISRRYKVSKATVYRKMAASSGRLTIKNTSPDRSINKTIKSRSFSPEAVNWAITQYLGTPRIIIKDLYIKLKREALSNGWGIGSLPALYRIINSIPTPMVACAMGGKRALETRFMPKMRRDLSFYHVQEVIVGDQHIFDYVVIDDDGSTFVPEMYAWMDMRSRYWVGVSPSFGHYSSADIGLSLKEACKFGIPKVIYTDNGRPELSKYVTGLVAQLSGLTIKHDSIDEDNDFDISTENSVRHSKARPRTPRAKIIESHFYHGMESLLMKRDLPGYRHRSFDEFENERINKELSQLKREGKLLHYKEFWQEVLSVIKEANQRTLTTENIIPEQYYFEHLPEAPLLRFDEETLDFIFLPSCRRRVRESSVQITLPGFGKCIYFSRDLGAWTGKEIEIRFNVYDNERIYALDPSSHKLIALPKLEREINPKDQEQVREKIRRNASFVREWIDQTQKYTKNLQRNYPVRLSPYTQTAGQASERKEADRTKRDTEIALDRTLINLYEKTVQQAI